MACSLASLPTCCVTLGMPRHLSEFPIFASNKCHHLIFSSAVYHLTFHRLRPTQLKKLNDGPSPVGLQLPILSICICCLTITGSATGLGAPQASSACSFLAHCRFTTNAYFFLLFFLNCGRSLITYCAVLSCFSCV